MKTKIIVLFLFFLSTSAFCQETIFGFGGGINKLGYQMGVEMGYKLNNSFTASLACRFQTIVTDGGHYGDSNKNYEWRIDDIDVNNILLIPSVRFSLPIIKKNNIVWSLYIEPGIMIQSFTYEEFDVTCQAIQKPYNGQTIWTDRAKGDFKLARFYLLNKFAIQYRSEDIALFGGFELSNQDVYSKRRSVKIDGVSIESHLPGRKNVCNSIFVGIRFYL